MTHCKYCGHTLPEDCYKSKQYCNVTCRVAAWRLRKECAIFAEAFEKLDERKIFIQR